MDLVSLSPWSKSMNNDQGENSRGDQAFNALRDLLENPTELGKWKRKRRSPKRDTLLRHRDLLIDARQQLSIRSLTGFLNSNGMAVGEALVADVLHQLGVSRSRKKG